MINMVRLFFNQKTVVQKFLQAQMGNMKNNNAKISKENI